MVRSSTLAQIACRLAIAMTEFGPRPATYRRRTSPFPAAVRVDDQQMDGVGPDIEHPEPLKVNPRIEEDQCEQLAVLRRELNGLVAAWNHRTGQPHGVTHAALRKECGGPAAAVATADQLQGRIDRIRDWAAQRRSS